MPCFDTFSPLWQRSFSSLPASFRMTRSPAVAVVVDSVAAAADSMGVACGPEASMGVVCGPLTSGAVLFVPVDIGWPGADTDIVQ
jgi:hypothetical protein